MPNYRPKNPKITWGAAFANTLSIAYPCDDVRAYSLPRDGFDTVQGKSGIEDAWDQGHDQFFTGRVRWIPQVTGVSPEGNAATGWEGATGFRAFLEWARAKNIFRFFPDAASGTFYTCYLVEPMTDPPVNEVDFTRVLQAFSFRTSDGAAVDGY